MNRSRLNLVLLVSAAALGVGVWFAQEKVEKGPPLTALTAEALTSIRIEHPGRDAIALEKRDGQWALTAPVAARVDDFEINGLLALVDREAKQSLDLAQVKLPELGLEPPKYTITLNDTEVAFGDVEPLQYRRYVKVGDAVSLIEDPPSSALDADYADLVAKSLFALDARIEKISVPKLTVTRGSEGTWSAVPADPKSSPDRLQKFVDSWKSARAMWNELATDRKPKGEAIKITLAGGEEHAFVLIAREPQLKLYSPLTGVNYVLSKALESELLQLPEIPEPRVATDAVPAETDAATP